MDLNYEISEIKKLIVTINEQLLHRYHAEPIPHIYDLTDLQKALHVSRRTIATWMSEKILPFSKIGNKIYITQKDLDEFLQKNKNNK